MEQNEPTFNTTVICVNNIFTEAQINKHRETKVSFHFHLDGVLIGSPCFVVSFHKSRKHSDKIRQLFKYCYNNNKY